MQVLVSPAKRVGPSKKILDRPLETNDISADHGAFTFTFKAAGQYDKSEYLYRVVLTPEEMAILIAPHDLLKHVA
ncbi:hypothetical protein [Oryzicola mucosus]|uniref:Uncharacterized protein n=1 Tax=Oryzicola mucosus TaxID=2767425 RepID=A0A8J6PLC6_9HYPH|nr:hypothetical protein [Oryzicola mucosus]MBD0413130.1 hypothetical protein [Oryzicola mucosus]